MSSSQKPGPVGFTAQNEWGRTYPDPSDGQLWRLLAELTLENRYLILTRLDHPGGEDYAQVRLDEPGHYDVEYRDGSAVEHFAAVATSLAAVHEVLTGWAQQRPGWRDTLVWERLDLES